MANLVPKVNNTGSLGTGAKKWSSVHTQTLDIGAQASDLSLNSQKITNLATPTAASDAANKAYVDDAVQGLSAKDSVRVATTEAETLNTDFANGQQIDGVTIATGDRILIKNQAAGAENGIYTVNASGAPTRAVDFDSNAEVAKGAYVFVEEGTVNANAGFVLTTDGAITLGTTALAFTQFSGAGQTTAGDGLAKSGNTLSVDIPGSAEMTGDLADTDELLVSDAGTLKRADFSVVRDAVFADVSGDATVAAGGSLSLASAAITGQTAETSIADDDLILISDTSASGALRKMTKANFVSGLGAASAINDLSDVTITSAASSEYLRYNGSAWVDAALSIVDDTTPQLGGSLDVNGQDIVSVSNGNITLTPNGSGVVRVDGASGIDLQSGEISVKNSGSVSNIKLYCEVGNAHYTQIQSAAHGSYSGNVTLTLPVATGTLVGSGDTGTVTNTMLAGSIANGKLANSAVTVTAGNGLSGGGSVALGATTSLALDLNELTAAVVDVAADSIVIVDANDGNASKKESVADLVAGVAGTGLSASSGQLSIDATVATLSGAQVLTNKTLTSPVLNTGVSGSAILDEDDMSSNSATKLATQQSIKAYVDTQVAGGGLNIDGYSALGGTGLHQTEDHFVFSDNGTEKKITFSNLEDAIFANITGDATIAAGGALTIGANAVEGSMLNNNTISGQTEMTGDLADDDELLVSDAGTLKRADFSVVRDAVFNDVSGDATIAAGGALTIAATSVENSMLAGSITADKMNNAIFADLETLGAPASDGQFIVATGSGAFAYESANTARTSLGLGTGDSPSFTSLTLSGQAGALAMNSQKITGLATPTADGDAATKSYVDSVAQGLSAKDSVRAATTANGTLATAFANGQAIDGVTLATGDRILLKNQTAGSENGIYTVNASGAPTRAVDFDENAEVAKGAFIFVEEGTANADAGFVLTTDGAITLGTTALAFTQFSGAGDINAGDALTKSGNTLNVAVDDSSIEVSGDALRVKAAGITSAMLAGSIANSKLNTLTTANKVALSALDLDGGTDIGADLVDADLVIVDDGAGGTNRKSALSRIKKYIFSSVSGDATASDAGALTIGANAIEGSMLNNNTISGQTEMTGDVADADELLISDNGTLKRADFSVVRDAVFADVSGDATIAAGGALTIGSGAIETAMVNDNVLTGQTAETSIADDDLVLIYDTSATALRKMTKANFVSGLSGGAAADDITTGDSAVNISTTSGNITIDAQQSDSDIIFKGTDGGQDRTFLTLDGSEAGAATFNAGITAQSLKLGDLQLSYGGSSTTQYMKLGMATNESNNEPIFLIENESTTSSGGKLAFSIKEANSNTVGNSDTLGTIDWRETASNGGVSTWCSQTGRVLDHTNNYGIIDLKVRSGSTSPASALEVGGSAGGTYVNIKNHDGTDSGLKLNGTLVTASATELNRLDGVTATAAELNYLDITAIGSVYASKALVVDANKDLDNSSNMIRNLRLSGDLTLSDGGSLKEAGGTAAFTFDGNGHVTKIGQSTPAANRYLKWDDTNSRAIWSTVSASLALDEISAGSGAATLSTSGDININSTTNGADIIFNGKNNGGGALQLLKLHGQDATYGHGYCEIYGNVTCQSVIPKFSGFYDLGSTSNRWGNVYLSDSKSIFFGNDQEIELKHDPDDGLILKMIGSTSYDPSLVLTSDSAGTTGPKLVLRHDSASPAAGDRVGTIEFAGDDSTGAFTSYGQISGFSSAVTNGAEVGKIIVSPYQAQTNSKGLSVEGVAGSSTKVKVNIDTHNGSDSGLHLDGTLVTSSAAELNSLDVSAQSPSDNEVLTYTAASGLHWASAGGGGGGSATIPDVQVVTANTSAAFASSGSNGDNERIYLVNNGANARTITLPAVSGNTGKKFQIKRLGTANVTIAVQNNEYLEGTQNGTFVLSSQYSSVTIVGNASGSSDGWYII